MLGKAGTVLSAAAAHHRLLWIHPFLDGNGRVARLMSYSMLRDALDTGGIWSIARGLARHESAYKGHPQACDQPRRNDLDGRGSHSEKALVEFTRFFLRTCLDQVTFMESLVEPNRLRERIRLWVEEEVRMDNLLPQAGKVLDAVLYRGELPRGDVPEVVGTGDRQARRIVSSLLEAGVLTAESSRAPLRITFPAALAGRWMPSLFPEPLAYFRSLAKSINLEGHKSGRITSHYSAAELSSLIEAVNKVVGQGSRKSPALVVLKKKAVTARAVTA